MQRKKILHLITGLGVGGTELFLVRLLSALSDFEHIVVSLTTIGGVGEALREHGIRIYALKSGKWFSPAAILRFFRIIKSERPDILSTWLLHADIFGRIFGKLFTIPKIVTHARLVPRPKKYLPYTVFTRFTHYLVDAWTANSKTVRDYYISKMRIPIEKISLIYNGIDEKKFTGLQPREEVRRELGIQNSDFVAISVARLVPQKNLEIIVDAIASMAHSLTTQERGKNIMFLFVGSGNEERSLIALAKQRGVARHIRFLGTRDDVPVLLAASDLFVFSSTHEGLSNALLEAVYSGIPIVATNIPENREILEQIRDVHLISLQNPGDLSKKIVFWYERISSPNFRKDSRQKREVPSFPSAVEGYKKLFQDLMLK